MDRTDSEVTFDPDRLTPLASLNSVRLFCSPNVPLPPDLAGRTAYHFLAATALAAQIRENAAALGLADAQETDDDTVLRHFDHALSAGNPLVRRTALALAERFGAYLGALIISLRRGDAADRSSRPEWGERHWAHWAGITTITLGGGLVSGRMGTVLAARAEQIVRHAGMGDCTIRRASWPALLPLLGAARAIPATTQTALIFDFGQSVVKRACAHYDGAALARLDLLPATPIRTITVTMGNHPKEAQVRGLAAALVAIVAETWATARSAGWDPEPVFAISLASYVRDGQPLPRRGGPYASLHLLSPHLATWLAEHLRGQVGPRPKCILLHDSSAAALTLARDRQAAVIMLGTALGVGFPSLTRGLRPIADNFMVLAGGVVQER